MKLREFKPEDAALILSWSQDEVAFRKWSADRYPTYPLSEADLIQNYQPHGEAGSSDFFRAYTMEDEDGIPRGSLILRCPDQDPSHIRFGFIIVDSSLRGKGYGKTMLTLAKELAEDTLGAKKLSLGVFRNNPPARHCYEAMGFRDNGASEACQILGETWVFDFMDLSLT